MFNLEDNQEKPMALMQDQQPITAVNWSKENSFVASVWTQQWNQIWFPEEIAVSKDRKSWKDFNFKEVFKKVLAGLTLLDTVQTNVGMNRIAAYTKDNMLKALFAVFDAFEAVHAKSYSYIFTTLCTQKEIDELFEWVKTNQQLQYKAQRISQIYNDIKEDDDISLYKGYVASTFLESFLFYSGFFYPLYLGGQGILRNSSEVISLILRDESLHGVTVGYEAQKLRATFSEDVQNEVDAWTYSLLMDLYDSEMDYTDMLYGETGTGLSGSVKAYVRYNANKALMNLGLEGVFPEEEINPIVLNGIRNDLTTYDFFSQKGTTYARATVEPINKKTFDLSDMMDFEHLYVKRA